MFSGIVEEIGRVVVCEPAAEVKLWDGSVGAGFVLRIQCSVVLEGCYIGCSIAVNGTCLTVTAFGADWFEACLAPETLRKTNLGDAGAGVDVNLERAMAVGGRNSGHFVQGHVDDTGVVLERWSEGSSLWVRVGVPRADLARYIVPKGFIAVDGTSLTVVDSFDITNPRTGDVTTTGGKGPCDRYGMSWFTLMLVPHTQASVVFPQRKVGDKVNLEVDVLAKVGDRAVATLEPRIAALEAMSSSPLSLPVLITVAAVSAALGAALAIYATAGRKKQP